MRKPAELFDRDREWAGLVRFATGPATHARLGIVSGRRRMGKTFLLRALVGQLGGFYFGATTATSGESLRQLGAAIGEFTGAKAPLFFATWDDAVSYLFGLSLPEPENQNAKPLLVVLDEFSYLVKAVPELPSLIQREIDRYQVENSGMRLLLCGSALSVMGGLLSSNAPLRGRAQLEMVVQPFGYRDAADFWDVQDDPALAARLHAVVGGTPAYRRQFLGDDVPESLDDFDDWLCRTVLSPLSPLFREARYLLAEEAELQQTALYHSVLAAVAQGNNTRGGIANYIGRKSVDISHPITVLEDCRLLVREIDVFRPGKSVYRITEPLISFYEAIMRPVWARLESGQAQQVWARSAQRFTSQVMGPHFEALCREFLQEKGFEELGIADLDADSEFPDPALGTVGCGVVPDPAARSQIQIDVALIHSGDGGHKPAVSLLGEAKWGTIMGNNHVERLRRARQLLAHSGWDVSPCRIACFSAAGFTDSLHETAKNDPEVRLIGLSELYG